MGVALAAHPALPFKSAHYSPSRQGRRLLQPIVVQLFSEVHPPWYQAHDGRCAAHAAPLQPQDAVALSCEARHSVTIVACPCTACDATPSALL